MKYQLLITMYQFLNKILKAVTDCEIYFCKTIQEYSKKQLNCQTYMGINKIPTSDDVICSEERLPPDIMRQKVTKLNISSPYTKTESYITLAML